MSTIRVFNHLNANPTQQGLVKEEQTQEGNRPPQRVYHITATGEAHFLKLLRENLADHVPACYPTDSGIAFMDQLLPQEVVTNLGRKREKIVAELEALQNATGHSGPLQHVLDHNRRLLQAELEWLDGLLKSTDRSQKDDRAACD